MAKADKKLNEIREATGKQFLLEKLEPTNCRAILFTLMKVFAPVTDKRIKSKCKYPTADIIVSTVLAMICGANTWVDIADFTYNHIEIYIEARMFLESTPAHDTYSRVFRKINVEELRVCSVGYLVQYTDAAYEYIMANNTIIANNKLKQLCIDGQYLKHSGRSNDSKNPTPMKGIIHVYDASSEITVDALEVGPKTNEIPIVQNSVRNKDISQYIITADALHTQKDTINAIANPEFRTGPNKFKTGRYVIGVKENQPQLFESFNNTFTVSKIKELEKAEKMHFTDDDHKRKTVRKYYMTPAPCGKDEWYDLKYFVCCITFTKGAYRDTRYYITSLDDIELIAECIRTHWWVENKVHYVLDTVYKQDANTTMDKDAVRSRGLIFTFIDSLIKLRNAIFNRHDSRNSIRVSCDVTTKVLGELFLSLPKCAYAMHAHNAA